MKKFLSLLLVFAVIASVGGMMSACGGDGGETSPTSQTEATTPSQGNSSGEKTVYADDSGSAAISDFLLGQFPKLTQKFAGFL